MYDGSLWNAYSIVDFVIVCYSKLDGLALRVGRL